MHQLSDEDLLKELAARVEEKNRALFDLRMTTARLEEVNRRLVESEALKGHFLSNIRNEINNPLAVIIAMAGEISAGIARDPAECRTLAAAIQSEAFTLDFQMRNIFCAAEIEAGEALPTAAQVDLRALVEATVSSFGPLAAAQGLEVRTPLGGGAGSRAVLRHRPGEAAADPGEPPLQRGEVRRRRRRGAGRACTAAPASCG